MTRARMPRPHEVAAARRDPRLLRAFSERDLDPGWRTRGVCQNVDPETFFPAPSEPADAAVALCRTCDVQGACLAWALDVGDCHGVWGATTPRERRAMLVAWRAQGYRMSPSAQDGSAEGEFSRAEMTPDLSPPGMAVDLTGAAGNGSRPVVEDVDDAMRERMMGLLPLVPANSS
jgi:WhiB family transcriptional regulator, redox-sensing transcriptional regulator